MNFGYTCTMKSEFLQNWETQLKKGLLPLFVLQLLRKQERYGYELIEEISRVFGIDVTEGTIYPLLVRLANEGLLQARWVEQGSGIPRKYYQITKEGEKALQNMKRTINDTHAKL